VIGVLTGRRVALIGAGFFLAFLIPNIILTWTAVDTFSGVVVDDSYGASQEFDRRRTAQLALGWAAELEHAGDVLSIRITDGDGRTVRPTALAVTVGRPTSTRSDQAVVLEETPGGYAGLARLDPGAWRVEISAAAADGTAFRQSRDLTVP
jgi:nitrogen fixation protein FixH